MKKRNAYGAMFMAFMAGMSLLSGSDHAITISIISIVVAIFVANGWGLNVEEDGPVESYESEQVNESRKVV